MDRTSRPLLPGLSKRIVLPAGWGEAILHACPVPEGEGSLPRSHVSDGSTLVWRIPPEGVAKTPGYRGRFACDCERRDRFDAGTVRLLGARPEDAAEAWVVMELLAKLCDIPVLEFLRNRSRLCSLPGRELPVPRVELESYGVPGEAEIHLTSVRVKPCMPGRRSGDPNVPEYIAGFARIRAGATARRALAC